MARGIMALFLLKKLISLFVTFILITMVVFAVVKLTPGNPFSIYQASQEKAVAKMAPADYEELLKRYDLDKPIYVQYKKWLFSLIGGSLGESFSERRPVSDVIGERLFPTLFLNFFSLLIMLMISIPVGTFSALRKDSLFDKISGGVLYGLFALPSFWIAVLLILFFGVTLKIFPFFGMHSDGAGEFGFFRSTLDLMYHALLPAVCMALGGLAFFARFTRSALLEVMHQDYVRTAKAKGVPGGKLFFRHILRSALIPFVTLFGLILPEMVAGSVIIESVFSWPGLGQLYLKAVYTRDYPVIMAESVLGAVLVLFSSIFTDFGYFIVDPRTRRR
jgi:peptide/nickel transport system permease protein